MDGTASGKGGSGVNAVRVAVAVVLLVFSAGAAAAQTAGSSSFRILQRGETIGSADVSLVREQDGWRIRSTSRVGGSIDVTVKRFDAQYDGNWRGRFLTVERSGPRSSTLMHAVAGANTAHVDIVTAKQARWHSHSVSPDLVFLPDHAYAAFVAVAARLHDAGPRAEIPLLLVPDSERRAIVDAWERVSVETRTGPVRASRHTLSLVGPIPTLLHVWEAEGSLLRVDVPGEDVSMIRADVVP